MKRTFIFLTAVCAAALLASCYDDKGNYDYHEINDIEITTSEYSYTTPKEGMTGQVVIEPTITQTMTPGTENLAYEWKRQTGGVSWEVVGTDPTYTLVVTSDDKAAIYLRLSVTDTNQGITTYEEITVKPIAKFRQTWFLLQEIDGAAVLGSVDGSGSSRVVTADVYRQETGSPLTGKPVGLGMHNQYNTAEYGIGEDYETLLGVFTDAKPYVLDGSTLEEHRLNYQRLLYEKKIKNDPTFDPQLMKGDKNNFPIIDAGKFWYSSPDEFALLFPIVLSDELGGGYDYKAAGIGFTTRSQCIIYDEQGNRFLRFLDGEARGMLRNTRQSIVNGGGTNDQLYMDILNGTSAQAKFLQKITSMGEGKPSLPNVFDPDHLASGFKLDWMGAAQGDYCETILVIGHVGQNFQIYEINAWALDDIDIGKNFPYCSNTWTFPVADAEAATTDGKIPAASSSRFERLMFYAAGNKIYRVNLSQTSPVSEAIYETASPEDRIKFLKFKSDNLNIAHLDGDAYVHTYITGDLGAVVEDAAGNARLVELPLTVAGEVDRDAEKNPIVYEFKGFEHVKDFIFSFRPVD